MIDGQTQQYVAGYKWESGHTMLTVDYWEASSCHNTKMKCSLKQLSLKETDMGIKQEALRFEKNIVGT